jgi:hypothetical protein
LGRGLSILGLGHPVEDAKMANVGFSDNRNDRIEFEDRDVHSASQQRADKNDYDDRRGKPDVRKDNSYDPDENKASNREQNEQENGKEEETVMEIDVFLLSPPKPTAFLCTTLIVDFNLF